TLQLPGRERRRAPLEREVTEPELEQHVEARGGVGTNALRDDFLFGMIFGSVGGLLPLGVRPQNRREPLEQQARELGDVEAVELHAERLGLETLAVAGPAVAR